MPLPRAASAPAEWRRYAISEYDYSMLPVAAKLGVEPRDARLFMVADKRWKYVHAHRLPADALRPARPTPDEFRDLGADPAYEGERAAAGGRARRMGPAPVAAHHALGAADASARAASPQRRGILIGVWDESDVPEELWSRYLGDERMTARSAAIRPAVVARAPMLHVDNAARPFGNLAAQFELGSHDPQLARILAAAALLVAHASRCPPTPSSAASPSASSSRSPPAAPATRWRGCWPSSMRTALNQPVIVENRTGAQGRLGVQAVKTAAPDGKTILLTPVAPMSVYQHVYKALAYDPIADFEPLSQVATFDFAIAVGPQVPAKSLKELVDWVKANPAQGTYGTPAAGTLPHFFAVVVRQGRRPRPAPRRLPRLGGGAHRPDRRADPHRRHHHQRRARAAQGRRASACWPPPTGERSPFLPDVPTFKEAGYDIEGTRLVRPVRAGQDAARRWSSASTRRSWPRCKRRRSRSGCWPSAWCRPARPRRSSARIQKADSELWAPAVKASGFTPEQ